MNSRILWAEQEDRTIEQLVRKYGQKSWANIANYLTQHFGTNRSGKQCRQRWHNHLNPQIEKKSWSKKEQEQLFHLHKLHGNKWTVIAQNLPGRTDNSIKNYFYSTIRRSLRRISKFLGSKNSTEQIKDIKPSTLSKIFAADNELSPDEFYSSQEKQLVRYIKKYSQTVRQSIVKFINYKPKKTEKAEKDEKGQLQDVINKMIHVNSIYQKLKNDENMKKKDSSETKKVKNNSDSSLDDSSLSEDNSQDLKNKTQIKIKSEDMDIQENKNSNSKFQPVKIEPKTQVKSYDFISVNTPQTYQKQDPVQSFGQSEKLKNLEGIFESEFFVELKEEDQIPMFRRNSSSMSLQSPGFPLTTPSSNPFNFFLSPSNTPHSIFKENITSSLGQLQNSTLDEFQTLIQQQIETNLKGQNKKVSSTTIGSSPGSAFSYYFQ